MSYGQNELFSNSIYHEHAVELINFVETVDFLGVAPDSRLNRGCVSMFYLFTRQRLRSPAR